MKNGSNMANFDLKWTTPWHHGNQDLRLGPSGILGGWSGRGGDAGEGRGEGMKLAVFKRHRYATLLGVFPPCMPSQALLSFKTTQNNIGWPFGSQPSTTTLYSFGYSYAFHKVRSSGLTGLPVSHTLFYQNLYFTPGYAVYAAYADRTVYAVRAGTRKTGPVRRARSCLVSVLTA